MNLEFINPQNLGSYLMKSSQSSFNLQSPGSYLVHSYLITTCHIHIVLRINPIDDYLYTNFHLQFHFFKVTKQNHTFFLDVRAFNTIIAISILI